MHTQQKAPSLAGSQLPAGGGGERAGVCLCVCTCVCVTYCADMLVCPCVCVPMYLFVPVCSMCVVMSTYACEFVRVLYARVSLGVCH